MPTGPDIFRILIASALSSKSSTTWRAVIARGRAGRVRKRSPAVAGAASRTDAVALTILSFPRIPLHGVERFFHRAQGEAQFVNLDCERGREAHDTIGV